MGDEFRYIFFEESLDWLRTGGLSCANDMDVHVERAPIAILLKKKTNNQEIQE